MAIEQIANKAASTLNGSITSTATTLDVNDAANFPASGNFRIIVDDEVMLVTAVSADTFTVTRGIESTTAAAHSGGAAVTLLVTAASLAQLLSDSTAHPLGGLAPYRTRLARTEAAALATSATITLASLTGSGTVLAIWATTAASDQLGRDTVVKIYVDGEASPSVQFDFGVLGAHWVTTPHRYTTMHTSSEEKIDLGGTIVLRYPIPYSTSCRVDLVNASATISGTAWGQVLYTQDLTSDLRLKSSNNTYKNAVTVASGGNRDFLNLAAGHAGVIVWHSLVCANATSNLFMESDINLKIDGESVASISATGTEDWFLSGNYFVGGAVSAPYAYCSLIDTTNHRMNAGLDLLAYCGGIRYTNGVVMNWDCSEMTDTSVDIAYLVLYYEEAS